MQIDPDATIQELRAEAKRQGLSGAGSKNELRERLESEGQPVADRYAIVRRDARAWWCPVCDRANTHLVQTCQCGAVRDGDRVRPKDTD
jgi:hypothetical protein